MNRRVRQPARMLAGLFVLTIIAPLAGCGNPNRTYAGNQQPYNAPQQQRGGGLSNMSRGQKLAVLAGTAALIYLYNKHKNQRGTGAQGQYYRSRNGRVYYRDAQGNPVWVTPPSGGIQVPAEEAQTYQRAAQRGQWDVGYAPAGPRGPAGGY